MKIMKKALCVGALATTAALGSVGAAAAAPAPASQANIQTASAVKSSGTIASGQIASRSGRVVPNVNPVVFSCSYFSLVPFQSFQFTCTVQSGRLQLFLVCSNGQRVFSPVMPAINTYTPVLSCPAGTQATSIMWQAV